MLDPGPGADLNRPPAEIEDEQQRARVAAAERAHRDQARAPYIAPQRPQIAFTRVGTNATDQLVHITEVLQTADPARVFGVYRVPDRFDLNRGSEQHAYVEWEIAHAPGALQGAPTPVAMSALSRCEHLVLRSAGRPGSTGRGRDGRRDRPGPAPARGLLRPHPRAHHPRHRGQRRRELGTRTSRARCCSPAPTSRAPSPRPRRTPRSNAPFHLELLDWEAVAAWNAPWRFGGPRTPAPLPHLPSSWQELLIAHLEVVGIAPHDCYGVQVTRTRTGGLADLSLASFRKNFTRPKLPCADGTPRPRVQTAQTIVLAYRDRPEYAEGRARWSAYQREVLRARLDHRTDQREPIVVDDRPRPSFAEEVFDLFNPLDPGSALPQIRNRNARPSLGPYCGELP